MNMENLSASVRSGPCFRETIHFWQNIEFCYKRDQFTQLRVTRDNKEGANLRNMATKPTHDAPHGMEAYDLASSDDLGALSNEQQEKLNQFKVKF